MSDEKTPEDKQGRLEDILRAAFRGPPTPLKDIPKQNGEPRRKKTDVRS